MLLTEVVQILEMARPKKICPDCGKSMAGKEWVDSTIAIMPSGSKDDSIPQVDIFHKKGVYNGTFDTVEDAKKDITRLEEEGVDVSSISIEKAKDNKFYLYSEYVLDKKKSMAGKRSSFMPLPEDTEDWLRRALAQRKWNKKDIDDYVIAFKKEDHEKQKEIISRQKQMLDAQERYGGGAYRVAIAGKGQGGKTNENGI